MRYAIYYTPPADDPLTRRAARWLGRDIFTGEMLAQPILEAFSDAAFAALTADPRRYAFHATLKAPFELAADRSESDLMSALEDFAAATSAFALPALVVGQLGRFFALVPSAPSSELQALADDCVRRFDVFRAPPEEKDIARRRPESLTPPQRRNLRDWGYPFVFGEFRFHMTLTAEVEPDDQPAMRAAIDSHFAEVVPGVRPVEHLALFAEPERGAPFVLRNIVRLAGSPRGRIT